MAMFSLTIGEKAANATQSMFGLTMDSQRHGNMILQSGYGFKPGESCDTTDSNGIT